jgi:signal peptidase II
MKCSIAWLYWFIGITIFCIDRITKNIALALFSERIYSDLPGLSYEVTFNRGIAWGMLHSYKLTKFMLVSGLQFLMLMYLIYWAYYAYKQCKPIFGHVCIIVGLLSNLIDRAFYKGVIDFIIVSFRDYSWPVFNIADMAIVIGIGIIAWQLHKDA